MMAGGLDIILLLQTASTPKPSPCCSVSAYFTPVLLRLSSLNPEQNVSAERTLVSIR